MRTVTTRAPHRPTVKTIIAVLFSFVLLPAILAAQELPHYTISGTVTDEETGEPLHYVNVFLANTTLGTATASDGKFAIHSIPSGAYTLVVSMIGYKRMAREIVITAGSGKNFHIELNQESVQGPLITVIGKRDKEFSRLLRKIKPFLLGISHNAGRCEIENPEVLTITATEDDRLIEASSAYPLYIINNALGYRIDMYIGQFTILDAQRVDYLLYPRFTPMPPKNKGEARRWAKKREEAYRGSLAHLCRALVEDRLDQEDFALYEYKKQLTFLEPVRNAKLTSAQLIRASHVPGEYLVMLPDWLKVDFLGEREVQEYYDYMRQAASGNRVPSSQISYIEALSSPLKVSGDGHLYKPREIISHGHLAFERLAEMLPQDYEPPRSVQFREREKLTPSRIIKAAIVLSEENKDLEKITEMFYEGLEKLGNAPFADTLFHGVKDILTTEELRGFDRCGDKGLFLLTVFQTRDPSPATPENERIPVHYQRLKYARTLFSSPQARGYDDRGEIWVRYGEPDLRERMPSNNLLYANECWVYWISNGIWFDFACSSGTHYDLIRDYMPVDITPAPDEVDQQPENIPVEFWERRRHLHVIFEALANKKTTGLDESDVQDFRDIVPRTFNRQTRLPRSIDNLERLSKPLDLTVSSARFYRSGQTQLELYYALPYNELQLENGGDSLAVPLRSSWALRDVSGMVISHDDSWTDVPQQSDSRHYIDQTVIMASGFSYEVALELQHPLEQATVEQVIEFEGFSAAEEDLFLSDIQLASDIRPASVNGQPQKFIKNDLLVRPWPFDRIDKETPVFIYFEIYNLLVSSSGYTDAEVSYEVRYVKRGLQRVNIFSRAPSYGIGTTFDLQVKHRTEPVYFSLDLSAVESHEYTIIVTVKDRLAGRTFRREKGVYVE